MREAFFWEEDVDLTGVLNNVDTDRKRLQRELLMKKVAEKRNRLTFQKKEYERTETELRQLMSQLREK